MTTYKPFEKKNNQEIIVSDLLKRNVAYANVGPNNKTSPLFSSTCGLLVCSFISFISVYKFQKTKKLFYFYYFSPTRKTREKKVRNEK